MTIVRRGFRLDTEDPMAAPLLDFLDRMPRNKQHEFIRRALINEMMRELKTAEIVAALDEDPHPGNTSHSKPRRSSSSSPRRKTSAAERPAAASQAPEQLESSRPEPTPPMERPDAATPAFEEQVIGANAHLDEAPLGDAPGEPESAEDPGADDFSDLSRTF